MLRNMLAIALMVTIGSAQSLWAQGPTGREDAQQAIVEGAHVRLILTNKQRIDGVVATMAETGLYLVQDDGRTFIPYSRVSAIVDPITGQVLRQFSRPRISVRQWIGLAALGVLVGVVISCANGHCPFLPYS